jgi:hypothetical protein
MITNTQNPKGHPDAQQRRIEGVGYIAKAIIMLVGLAMFLGIALLPLATPHVAHLISPLLFYVLPCTLWLGIASTGIYVFHQDV